MGQIEIAKILQDNYPNYMSKKEIIKKAETNYRSVLRSLSKLKKRDEIEFIVIENKSMFAKWQTLYRTKK